ncbi:response regulator transcription factor [Deinococcus sp. Arct2-2]|uniref:response regulator n=1 Tax=Deinococcus sp. Arct2-2 TaxID=2568653 RepID=UPI0010A40EFA|nr:response regulator transcription factor [Deinococcus sp. Arct2-2]THF67865.1 response regulator transcription factor [Deinococcus sp. Arct2-2]
MKNVITVLMVDDHALVRQGVRAFLEAFDDVSVVAEASSGEEAVALAERHQPNVVLMDLLLPAMDGVEATRQVKHVSPATQVVVLTSHAQDEHIFPALRAGALSYVLKTLTPQALLETVRLAARGEATLHPRVAARVIRETFGPKEVTPNAFTELTKRELEILKLIAAGDTNAAIARRLEIGEKTVKGHVSNVLSKLRVTDRTQAAVFAWREGVVRKSNQEE